MLRLALASYLACSGLSRFGDPAGFTQEALRVAEAAAAVFILVGFWTPVVSTLAFLLEIGSVFTPAGRDPAAPALAAAIALSLALLGPGAHSADALAYGRKRISISNS